MSVEEFESLHFNTDNLTDQSTHYAWVPQSVSYASTFESLFVIDGAIDIATATASVNGDNVTSGLSENSFRVAGLSHLEPSLPSPSLWMATEKYEKISAPVSTAYLQFITSELIIGSTVENTDEYLSPIEIQEVMESEKEHKEGKSKVFSSADEMLEWLHEQ